jgi:hypothetical protein
MASKLTQLTSQKTASQIQSMTQESHKWLLQKIANIRNPSYIPRGIKAETYREASSFKVGKLYCFYYDPKGKNELPYYDTFPLVLMLERYNDGFLGLNLHYLPIKVRAVFLDKLMDHAVLNQDNEIQRMRITYDILVASKRYKEFQPCLKRYLHGHLKSRILTIQPEEWEVATFLPMHQFKKANAQQVWQESMEQIKERQRGTTDAEQS